MNYLNNLQDLEAHISNNPELSEYQIHIDNALNMTGDWVNVALALKGLYIAAAQDGNDDLRKRVITALTNFGD